MEGGRKVGGKWEGRGKEGGKWEGRGKGEGEERIQIQTGVSTTIRNKPLTPSAPVNSPLVALHCIALMCNSFG